jgi:FixJ family two-component response regulator
MTDPPALIAILDDEEKLRLALVRLLKAHGYAVTGFATGEALLAALAERRFDCVLLDLSMPGMSGFDVLASLQALAQPPPVIVITAHDGPETIRRALALDAVECQRKPVGGQTLLTAIKRVCRIARHERASPYGPGH